MGVGCSVAAEVRVPAAGGTAQADDRAVLTAAVYIPTSGCAWQLLPGEFGVSPAIAHRRFTAWTEAGSGGTPPARVTLHEARARKPEDRLVWGEKLTRYLLVGDHSSNLLDSSALTALGPAKQTPHTPVNTARVWSTFDR
ncbi:transposase [Streptomyces sp. NPDC004237]|uniref:transposase n=1 Tax=Streptomyces sp. NPDC004237 TaxID=3154455 RepID=UPI0033AF63F6